MKFINQTNNHIEEKSAPWLWALIFGGFYFLVSGAWVHFLIMLTLSAFFVFSQGAPGTLLVVLMQLAYAAFAPSIIRRRYLHAGWLELGATEQAAPNAPTAHTKDETVCPFCAETIKVQAIVCKHCGRDVPHKASTPPANGAQLPPFSG